MDVLIEKLEEFLKAPVMSLCDAAGAVIINGRRHELNEFPPELQGDIFLELGMSA